MAPFIGEFDVDPSTIVSAPLLEKKVHHVFEVKKAERSQKEGGNPYIRLELNAVDHPSTTITHFFSPASAKALEVRRSAISWSRFLQKLALPYTTLAPDLIGLRVVATVTHVGPQDEQEEKIESFVGRAA